MEHKVKFGIGIVAVSVPVFALYLGLAAPGPATAFLPAIPANRFTIVAGLGLFLLGWAAIAAWGFADPERPPRRATRQARARRPTGFGRLSAAHDAGTLP